MPPVDIIGVMGPSGCPDKTRRTRIKSNLFIELGPATIPNKFTPRKGYS